MGNKRIASIAGIALVIGLGVVTVVLVKSNQKARLDEQVFCTMEAKICPDGSGVGRKGPNCEFAPCPIATTTSASVSFGGTFEKDFIRVMPQELLEDSRCPLDVQCIQAGTVRVSVILDAEGEQKTIVMTQGMGVVFAGRTVELVSTLPAPNSKVTIRKEDYKFTFSVTLNN